MLQAVTRNRIECIGLKENLDAVIFQRKCDSNKKFFVCLYFKYRPYSVMWLVGV